MMSQLVFQSSRIIPANAIQRLHALNSLQFN
jgi:hypothetical protein